MAVNSVQLALPNVTELGLGSRDDLKLGGRVGKVTNTPMDPSTWSWSVRTINVKLGGPKSDLNTSQLLQTATHKSSAYTSQMHRLAIILALIASASLAVWLFSHPSWSWQNALVGLAFTHLWGGWRQTDRLITACVPDANDFVGDYRPVLRTVRCFSLVSVYGSGATLGGLLGEDVKDFLDKVIKKLPNKNRQRSTEALS